MIRLEGRIFGLNEVKRMYAAAPGAFFKAIRHRMYSERKRYIGTKGAHWLGKFRKKIMSKKHAGKGMMKRDGKWPKNVAAAFKGYLRGEQAIGTMEMHLGTGLRHPSKFSRGLTMMDAAFSGDRTIRSNKNMPVPLYKNIMRVYRGREMSRAFRDMNADGSLVPVVKNGRVFWFDKGGRYKRRTKEGKIFKKSALMFIGAKSIRLSPQFNFMNYLDGERPRIITRAKREIDGTVRRLSRGIVKSDDFKHAEGVTWE